MSEKKIITHYRFLGKLVAIMNEDLILTVLDPTLLLRTDYTVITVMGGEDNHNIFLIKQIKEYLKKQHEKIHGSLKRPTFVEKNFIREDLLTNEFP